MKFNCGLTNKEKLELYNKQVSDWHRHFLWWPRRMGYKDCRWLEFVERKREAYIEKVYYQYALGSYDVTKHKWRYRLPLGT